MAESLEFMEHGMRRIIKIMGLSLGLSLLSAAFYLINKFDFDELESFLDWDEELDEE